MNSYKTCATCTKRHNPANRCPALPETTVDTIKRGVAQDKARTLYATIRRKIHKSNVRKAVKSWLKKKER